jgi:hypothetical protein
MLIQTFLYTVQAKERQSDKISHKGTESEINISWYQLVYSLEVSVLLYHLFHIHFWLQNLTSVANRKATFEKYSAEAGI